MRIKHEIFAAHILQQLDDIWQVFTDELRRIFHDPGVITIMFVATLAYPVLYKVLYYNDQINNIPVAVVDMSASTHSRRFLHKWNATPDVTIAYMCQSMEEAEQLMKHQKIHGILYIPTDYAYHIETANGQARLSLYCDMSTFLYMKGIYMSINKVMLNEMHSIQLDRFERLGYGPSTSWVLTQGAPYTETALFCPSGGYGSFIIPPVMMLILHQTMLLAIGMLAGTAREEKKTLYWLPGRRRRRGAMRIVLGRSMAYFVLYYAMACVVLVLYPHIMNVPHIGNPLTVMVFVVPFLLATIYFTMTLSLAVHNRESGMVLFITTSLLFLFISGISWPTDSIPEFWRCVSHLIPSTWGINGFVRINTMGAGLHQVANCYRSLWILAGGYFALATLGLLIQGIREDEAARESIKNFFIKYIEKQ